MYRLHWGTLNVFQQKLLPTIIHFFRRVPGKLKQFVLDLHSGKLHREFHHGPDPVQEIEAKPEEKTEAPAAVDGTGENLAYKNADVSNIQEMLSTKKISPPLYLTLFLLSFSLTIACFI